MAGPWFAVQRAGGDWQTLDTIWLSDGSRTTTGRVELRVDFDEDDELDDDRPSS